MRRMSVRPIFKKRRIEFSYFVHSWKLFGFFRELEMEKNSWKIGSFIPTVWNRTQSSISSDQNKDADLVVLCDARPSSITNDLW